MAKARRIKQLSFMMPDKTGQLAVVTSAFEAAKVNIDNICAYGMQGEATFMLTTGALAKAKKALVHLGTGMREDDVVSVEMANKPGELQKVASKLAAGGINIVYMYGTAGSARSVVGILATSDNAKAIRLINKA